MIDETTAQAIAVDLSGGAVTAAHPAPDRIGVIFVHGIGEQKRFEHLDAEIRPLIDALTRRPASVSVEILGGNASTLYADRDTWSAQPSASVRAIVRQADGRETHLCFHEVWWADINEPYSLRKQVVFWLWGLSVWFYPDVPRHLPGWSVMQHPHFPGGRSVRRGVDARLRLFFVSTLFLLTGASVGTLVVVAKRLLNLDAPNIVRIFVNYLSAIKLYNQPSAAGGGFLDAFHEPPRVSIRRRMIRAMADVASQNYDRWYVLGHSLGSVVAYNGLMENAQALANYLDESRWRMLKTDGRAGAAPEGSGYFLGDTAAMMPSRPLWLNARDVVFRDKLLEKFRGLLTYGSPLDKFAAIWPRLTPVNVKEPMFPADAEWVNVYDPTDPVGAKLTAFSQTATGSALATHILVPNNLGYRSSPWLLLSHVRYLRSALADSTVDWLLSGNELKCLGKKSCWLHSEWLRHAWTYFQWLVVFALMLWLAVLMLPQWIGWGVKGLTALGRLLTHVPMLSALGAAVAAEHSSALELADRSISERSLWVFRWSLLSTLCIGLVGRIYFYLDEKWTAFRYPGAARPEEGYWASTRFARELLTNLVATIGQLFQHRAGPD
jgi:hypothetical protein